MQSSDHRKWFKKIKEDINCIGTIIIYIVMYFIFNIKFIY